MAQIRRTAPRLGFRWKEAEMWLPLIGLLVGLIIGSVFSITIPVEYTRYTAVAILAALDSVLGALRADMEGNFDNLIFVSGFFVNALLAVLLTLLGDRLGVELYYAAIVAFGVRMFTNLAIIRRGLMLRAREWWYKRSVS
jgi:small basic protein